jgi:hypothetical protein
VPGASGVSTQAWKEPVMRGVVMEVAGDVRVEEREDPKITEPTTRSSGSPRRVSVGRTCGLTGASSRSITSRWGTSTSAWWRKSATR